MLVLLARHAGDVVPREELLARLWPGAVVTDDALSRCIHELRRQLRGYRLNGEITGQLSSGARPARRTAFRPIVAAVAVAFAAAAVWWVISSRDDGSPGREGDKSTESPVYSIAVLAFADLSIGLDHGYFSDGISEEILNRLTQSPKLVLVRRPRAFE